MNILTLVSILNRKIKANMSELKFFFLTELRQAYLSCYFNDVSLSCSASCLLFLCLPTMKVIVLMEATVLCIVRPAFGKLASVAV